MAVNLTDLSLPQLEGLKTQLDQVVCLVYPCVCEECVLIKGSNQSFKRAENGPGYSAG